MIFYMLDDNKKIVETEDAVKWGRWLEKADTRIARNEKNGVVLSTIFLGINHNYESGTPILFETMVFGGVHDQHQERYTTLKEAELGHKRWYKKLYES